MSSTKDTAPKGSDSSQNPEQGKEAAAALKGPTVLEEDDEFEDFPVEGEKKAYSHSLLILQLPFL